MDQAEETSDQKEKIPQVQETSDQQEKVAQADEASSQKENMNQVEKDADQQEKTVEVDAASDQKDKLAQADGASDQKEKIVPADKASNQNVCRLLFLGKTSYDKRSTANYLFGEQVYDVQKYSDEIEIVERSIEIEGGGKYLVEISDAPGIMELDNVRRAASVLKKKRIQLTDSTGYHALVIVVSYPVRWTPEEKTFISTLNDVLGVHQIKKFGILVFTNGAAFEKGAENLSFEQYLDKEMAEKSKDSFGKVIKQIGKDKCMCIDTNDESTEKRQKKIEELFAKVQPIKDVYTTWYKFPHLN